MSMMTSILCEQSVAVHLLIRKGADIEARENELNYALFIVAARNGDEQLVTLLLGKARMRQKGTIDGPPCSAHRVTDMKEL